MTNSATQVTGIVKWFSNEKGWGFLIYEDKDYFVHHSDILGKGFKTLIKDSIVKFEPKSGEKGNVAKNVIQEGVILAGN